MSNIKTIEEIASAKGRRRAKTVLEDFKRRYPNYLVEENGKAPAFCVTFLSQGCVAYCTERDNHDCLECWKQPLPEDIR